MENEKYNMDPEDQQISKAGSIHNATQDAVFGEIREDGPNYRGV